MPHLPAILTKALAASFFAKYGLVMLAAVIEGPIVFFVSGFLWKLGVFDFLPLFISLTVGDLIGDTIWYFIGYRFGHPFINRFGKYFGVTEDSIKKVTSLLKKHDSKILILSKVTNGFGLSLGVLLTAGMTKMPYWKYLLYNAIGEIIWTGLLVAAGYFFGSWYSQINTWVGRVGIGFGILVIIVIFLQWHKYMKKRSDSFSDS